VTVTDMKMEFPRGISCPGLKRPPIIASNDEDPLDHAHTGIHSHSTSQALQGKAFPAT
jgi:hypothetical protein